MARVCNAGYVAGPDCYWYRGVVQYGSSVEMPHPDKPLPGYVIATPETAVKDYVWAGHEQFRDDPEAVAHWVERRPMDCWERVPGEPPNPDVPAEPSETPSRGQND